MTLLSALLALLPACSDPPPVAPAPTPRPAPAPAVPAPEPSPPREREWAYAPPWSAFTALATDETPAGCTLSLLRVAPGGVEPLRTIATLPGACGEEVEVTVSADASRIGVVYGPSRAVALVEAGVTRVLPPLPEPAATVRFSGTETRAFGVYDDVTVGVDDPPDDVPTYVATINGRTYHGWMTGDAPGGTPCGEWRLADGAWVHVADGLEGYDAGQGQACPDIERKPDGTTPLEGTPLQIEFPFPHWPSEVGRAPIYKGTLHGGGPFVVTVEWTHGEHEPVPGDWLEVEVPGDGGGTKADVLNSIPMTGNRLVAFDPPLVCSSIMGASVLSLRGPTAADAVKPIWEGKRCLRRWPDTLPLAPVSVAAEATPETPPSETPPPGAAAEAASSTPAEGAPPEVPAPEAPAPAPP